MLTPRDLLERLRPVGTPGAAAPAGVPADRRSGVEAELAPVFAALIDVEAECSRIRADAEAAAARRREAGTDHAAELVACARSDAGAERAAAAATRRHEVETEAAGLQARSDREAEEIRARSRAELPEIVAAVLDRVRGDLGAVAESTGARGHR